MAKSSCIKNNFTCSSQREAFILHFILDSMCDFVHPRTKYWIPINNNDIVKHIPLRPGDNFFEGPLKESIERGHTWTSDYSINNTSIVSKDEDDFLNLMLHVISKNKKIYGGMIVSSYFEVFGGLYRGESEDDPINRHEQFKKKFGEIPNEEIEKVKNKHLNRINIKYVSNGESLL